MTYAVAVAVYMAAFLLLSAVCLGLLIFAESVV